MTWEVKYLPEADKDIASLARNQQIVVQKAMVFLQKAFHRPLNIGFLYGCHSDPFLNGFADND